MSLNFIPKGQIDNNPTLVWMMAWHRICASLGGVNYASLTTHTPTPWVMLTSTGIDHDALLAGAAALHEWSVSILLRIISNKP